MQKKRATLIGPGAEFSKTTRQTGAPPRPTLRRNRRGSIQVSTRIPMVITSSDIVEVANIGRVFGLLFLLKEGGVERIQSMSRFPLHACLKKNQTLLLAAPNVRKFCKKKPFANFVLGREREREREREIALNGQAKQGNLIPSARQKGGFRLLLLASPPLPPPPPPC